MRKTVSGIMLSLLLIVLLILAFNIQPVEASGTIYIRADGSVDPDTAPISTVDNVTYTFTGNIIYDEIVVEKNNTVVDGAGYSIQGAWDLHRGISLYGVSNVTIKNMEIRAFEFGVSLNSGSSNNTISGNKITENAQGILLEFASDNTINGNNITNNYGAGIELDFSSNNTINGNNITENDIGILFYVSSFDNAIYHNNFIGNNRQVEILTFEGEQANFWDDGYPSGGNYWSNHVCTGNPSDGSQPYIIDENNIDHYPFQDPNGWLLHQLTITSSPITGVAFTIHEVPHITPYTEWLLAGSYTLVMPETHNGYVWSHWLEDGDPNRIKTVTLNTNNTLTAVFTLDTTPPTITIVSPENKTYPVNDVSLTFTVSESASWIGYKLDGQANLTITGNTTLSGLSDGSHSLIVYAKDTVGNTGASEIVYFTIETKKEEAFPIWIVAAIVIIAVVGAALVVYFIKVKKT